MSSETINRCAVCLCYLDDEDLFCGNCGTENPYTATTAVVQMESFVDQYSYDCQGCGASMSYDASAQALRCPFCGSTEMKSQQSRRAIQADWVVPLGVDFGNAERIFREWLGAGFWRPSDAAQTAQIGKIAAVYVPFWVFDAQADTKWTADSSPAPAGCRGDWYPVSGQNRSTHRSILVGASSILASSEVQAIAPYDLSNSVKPDQIDLVNAIVEIFRLPRKHARPLAQSLIEERERQICSGYVPGRARRVKVNVRIEGMSGRPVLLPVWILAYRYKDKVRRVLINGQTGKLAGDAPFSYVKLITVLAIVALVMVVLFGLIALLSAAQ